MLLIATYTTYVHFLSFSNSIGLHGWLFGVTPQSPILEDRENSLTKEEDEPVTQLSPSNFWVTWRWVLLGKGYPLIEGFSVEMFWSARLLRELMRKWEGAGSTIVPCCRNLTFPSALKNNINGIAKEVSLPGFYSTKCFQMENKNIHWVAVGIMEVSTASPLPKPHEMSFASVGGGMQTTLQETLNCTQYAGIPFHSSTAGSKAQGG